MGHGCCPAGAGQPQRWPMDVVPAATMAHRCGYPPRLGSIDGPSLRFAARICLLRRCRWPAWDRPGGRRTRRRASTDDLPVLRLARAVVSPFHREGPDPETGPFYRCPSLPSRNVSQSRIAGPSLSLPGLELPHRCPMDAVLTASLARRCRCQAAANSNHGPSLLLPSDQLHYMPEMSDKRGRAGTGRGPGGPGWAGTGRAGMGGDRAGRDGWGKAEAGGLEWAGARLGRAGVVHYVRLGEIGPLLRVPEIVACLADWRDRDSL